MARSGISYDEVKLAIDEMLAEGLNPTIAGLREKLGTGSFTTISEHLKRWRGERQEKPVAATGTPAPETLSGMMQSLWQQAREEANKELEQYKEKIDQEVKSALEEKQKALESALETEKKNSWLEDKNTELQNRISESERLTGQLQEQNQALTEEVELAGKQLEAVKKTAKEQQDAHLEKESELQQALDEQKDAVAEISKGFQQQLSEERKRSEQSEQHWLSQLDSERQKNKQLTDLLSSTKDIQQKLAGFGDKLEKQLQQLKQDQELYINTAIEKNGKNLTESVSELETQLQNQMTAQQELTGTLDNQLQLMQHQLTDIQQKPHWLWSVNWQTKSDN
ncbi:DNA-binding protein [Oceanospirillum sediminis]|uniref:DNA-binding protein n=1 Tax=Oceanospirillum sediminis TaxID=2760088 RepID=A0A839IVV3_9GAMM|nr:DNA-binding protein [Oceanospirillum sediminis]MBB1488754.1 DNA-binding protein [Oceanospirillum sediminis]